MLCYGPRRCLRCKLVVTDRCHSHDSTCQFIGKLTGSRKGHRNSTWVRLHRSFMHKSNYTFVGEYDRAFKLQSPEARFARTRRFISESRGRPLFPRRAHGYIYRHRPGCCTSVVMSIICRLQDSQALRLQSTRHTTATRHCN
jgi:hypothetical protein